mgnify:CR=1 FL=1
MNSISAENRKTLMLFSGRAHPELADEIGTVLGVAPTPTVRKRCRRCWRRHTAFKKISLSYAGRARNRAAASIDPMKSRMKDQLR